MTILYT